jgi:hypothetical protein
MDRQGALRLLTVRCSLVDERDQLVGFEEGQGFRMDRFDLFSRSAG